MLLLVVSSFGKGLLRMRGATDRITGILVTLFVTLVWRLIPGTVATLHSWFRRVYGYIDLRFAMRGHHD